jgi:hypothetical protein
LESRNSSEYRFEKSSGKNMFKPAFDSKSPTIFYHIKKGNKIMAEIEVNPKGYNNKPEIMSAFSNKKGVGLGKMMVDAVLDIYLKDVVYVQVTKTSKAFWKKMGAVQFEDDMYVFEK